MATKRIPRGPSLSLASLEWTVGAVADALEARAPSATAESWDNVGLLVGDRKQKLKKILIAVDPSVDQIHRAAEEGIGLIITHHPCIFPKERGILRALAGELAFEAARSGVAIFASHTNFDRCAVELAQLIPAALSPQESRRKQWTPVSRLLGSSDSGDRALMKLVTFVPEGHLEAVIEALSAVGAGRIGLYEQCSFWVSGLGSFRPGPGARPWLGKIGRREIAPECRLEMILPRGLKARVVRTLRQVHPYEEPAIDLIPVEAGAQPIGIHPGVGYGVVLESPGASGVPISGFVRQLKGAFQLPALRLNGVAAESPQMKIRKFGFVAGKGSSLLASAIAQGCDCFVTGELDYHEALRAQRCGVLTIELGHSESERFFPIVMTGWLKELSQKLSGSGVELFLDEPYRQMNIR